MGTQEQIEEVNSYGKDLRAYKFIKIMSAVKKIYETNLYDLGD